MSDEVATPHHFGGKVVVVTGAAVILGRRFCEGLAAAGASVAVVDLDEKISVEFAERLAAQHPVRTLGIGCDVANEDSVSRMTYRVVAELGGVYGLLNNAATKGNDVRRFFTEFEEYPLDVWREVMAVNLDGMFLVAKHVGRQMLAAAQGGSIVQTSSVYGLVAPDDRIYEGSDYLGGAINTPASYAASKAGVIGLTRYLAARWGAKGIRVNCLVPGGVASGQNEEFKARYSARVPAGRMAEASEIVNAALFLLSDRSTYITGQNLVVDGGLTVW